MARRSATGDKEGRKWIAPAAVAVCAVLAYCNSFRGPFVFDDLDAIRHNPDFASAVPAGGRANYSPIMGSASAATTISGRPILWLTFKLDSLVAGQNVEIYHATNLVIHLCAGLLLFGIVRRALMLPIWRGRFAGEEAMLAGCVASMWVVHPLNTEAVTYVVQRAESFAGMFYLAVIYCLVRSEETEAGMSGWEVAAGAACALSALTKEIAVTAPVMAVLFDRTFLAGSFWGALKRRWRLYVMLAVSWIVLAGLLIQGHGRGNTVGFGEGMSALDYGRTQLGVIAHYLRLMVWPTGLSLSLADWPVARSWTQVGWGGWFVAGLAILTAIALWARPVLGFLGAWFFVILAPSSSVVPIVTEVAAEHRMYLSLAAPIALAVVGGWIWAKRWRVERVALGIEWAAVAALMVATIQRNNVYRTGMSIWSDTLAQWPNDVQAHFGLGYAWAEVDWSSAPGSPEAEQAAKAAAGEFQKVLDRKPNSYQAGFLLGHMLFDSGDLSAAERFYDSVLAGKSTLEVDAHMMRGLVRVRRDDIEDARTDFAAVLTLTPQDADAHFFLGMCLLSLHREVEAREEFSLAMKINPHHRGAAMQLQRMGGD
jgi:tetratricopeptide (TPR) repeat protein